MKKQYIRWGGADSLVEKGAFAASPGLPAAIYSIY